MNTHGTDRVVPTVQQIKQLGILLGFVLEVVTRIVTRYFFALSSDEAKALLQSKGALSAKIKEALGPVFVVVVDEYAAQRTYWEGIYRTHFGIDTDLSGIMIPPKPLEGKWRLLFILQGFTINRAIVAYCGVLVAHDSKWKVWQYMDDLDAVTKSIRTTVESYAIWVRDEQESDQEFRGQTTRQVDSDQSVGVTLLERLIHGAVHFVETKQHLDEKGFTLCSGSRDAGGFVPGVDWRPGLRQVDVRWYDLDDAYSCGGVRRAVALPQVAQIA